MPWVTFTEQDVRDRMTERELVTFDGVATKNYPDSSGDPTPPASSKIPGVVAQVLAKYRGAIRSNPQVNQLGPAGTLPDFCIFDAAVIARTALIALPPAVEGGSDPRRDEYRDAVAAFKLLSSMSPLAFADSDPVPQESGLSDVGGDKLLNFSI